MRAASVAPLAYQWFFGDHPVPNENDSALLLNNLSAGQAGAYYLVAGNYLGSVTSRVATLTVSQSTLPNTTNQSLLKLAGFIDTVNRRPLLLINKPSDQLLQIESSTDLQNWQPFSLITDPVSQLFLTDEAANPAGQTFYRAVLTNSIGPAP